MQGTIRSIAVRGNERLEPETVRAYANLAPGQNYTAASLDAALKELYATELFTDVVITGAETGNLVITVRENPVINRIVLEGNKRLKNDKILPEIKLAPRQIFTRSKVRADVERIVELYRREGRFAARVEPKVVQLDQNRVDLVFEIFEGDKSKVRRINIIGNDEFGDDRLRKEMYTRQAGGVLGFLKSNDSYDPDRLAADQQKLRAFYLTQGYADFRVVSALAELTPDRRDFIITYVVEEGPRYKFGTIEAESALRDLPAEKIKEVVDLKPGSWFNAKAVEDAVTDLNEDAGNLGYAFADINPAYNRDAEKRVMNITFRVGETPASMSSGSTSRATRSTRDKVIRREFRINEGDAFNAMKVKRSQDRLQSLGFFQEKSRDQADRGLGPGPGRARRQCRGEVDRRASAVGWLFEPRAVRPPAFSIAQRNFMGKGQELNAGVNWSRYSRSVQLGLRRTLSVRQADPARRRHLPPRLQQLQFRRQRAEHDLFADQHRRRACRLGFPITEFITLGTRYSLVLDNITLDKSTFFTIPTLSPTRMALARYRQRRTVATGLRPGQGRHSICAMSSASGSRRRSVIQPFTTIPTAFARRAASGSSCRRTFAGLGGDVQIYSHPRLTRIKYWSPEFLGGIGFSRRTSRAVTSIRSKRLRAWAATRSASRDRFFGPQLRGFDIRGIGPRILREPYDDNGLHRHRRKPRRAMRSAAGLITWAGWSSSSRPARRCAALAFARRHSSILARSGR